VLRPLDFAVLRLPDDFAVLRLPDDFAVLLLRLFSAISPPLVETLTDRATQIRARRRNSPAESRYG
jgi:hypothetical protein